MRRSWSRAFVRGGVLAVVSGAFAAPLPGCSSPRGEEVGSVGQRLSDNIVISQVYLGGGSNGVFKQDYVELFNAGDVQVPLAGGSIQYGSAGGKFGNNAATIVALPAVLLN